jgi:hypothetical protein
MLLILTLLIFAVAAALGLGLAALYARGKLSLPLAMVHGGAAATALILLIVAAVTARTSSLGNFALAGFVIAALGGFVLIYNHLSKGQLPKWLIAVHGAVAVLSFILLLIGGLNAAGAS